MITPYYRVTNMVMGQAPIPTHETPHKHTVHRGNKYRYFRATHMAIGSSPVTCRPDIWTPILNHTVMGPLVAGKKYFHHWLHVTFDHAHVIYY